jgi:hypothetical protein
MSRMRTPVRTPTDEELMEKAEEIRRSLRTRADRIKEQLCRWIDQNVSRSDAVPATVALLELVIEARLVKERPDDTLEFVTRIFHNVAQAQTGAGTKLN